MCVISYNTNQMQRAAPRCADGVRGASNVSFILLNIYNYVDCYIDYYIGYFIYSSCVTSCII